VKDAHPSEAIALVDLLTFLLSYSPLAHANAAAQRRRDGRPAGGKALPHNASGSYVASFRGFCCEGPLTRNLGVRRLAAAFARLQCILRRGGPPRPPARKYTRREGTETLPYGPLGHYLSARGKPGALKR
jgi:hypothetical protein